MFRDYDIFECRIDGSLIWRDAVQGLENAHAKLKELALHSTNEFFAVHSPTQEVVARVNASD